MLRSVLVAAFSAVVAIGALSGLSDVKGDVRANTQWPVAPVTSEPTGHAADAAAEGAGG